MSKTYTTKCGRFEVTIATPDDMAYGRLNLFPVLDVQYLGTAPVKNL